MSYNCNGCDYDKILNGHSYCEYYRAEKIFMDRDRGLKYLSFKHGKCSHDTRKNLDELK